MLLFLPGLALFPLGGDEVFVLEKFVLVVKRVKIPVMEMVAPPLFANHKKAIGMSLVW